MNDPRFVPGFEVQGSRFKIRGVGLRVYGLGCRIEGVGFRVWGLGFGAWINDPLRAPSVVEKPGSVHEMKVPAWCRVCQHQARML